MCAEGILETIPTSSIVGPRFNRQQWRETVIFGRAKGIIRNRAAYLRAALPAFIADEAHEIAQWIALQLIEYIESDRPSINEMQIFVRRTAEVNDLPLNEDLVDPIIEIAYFNWKTRLASGTTTTGHKANGQTELLHLTK